jgi:hypothetical protein
LNLFANNRFHQCNMFHGCSASSKSSGCLYKCNANLFTNATRRDNLVVADFHTYFVGSDEWGFEVWAHNVYTRAQIGAKGEQVVEREEGAEGPRRASPQCPDE